MPGSTETSVTPVNWLEHSIELPRVGRGLGGEDGENMGTQRPEQEAGGLATSWGYRT